MKEPLYRDQLIAGLNEYVIQDLSALAGRPYDSGKFLFSISSLMLVATLSLVTAFKGSYLVCLIATIPLMFSFRYSFNLTIAVVKREKGTTREALEKQSGYEIEINNPIYQEYINKNNWWARSVKNWKICMGIFVLLIISTVGYATFTTNNENKEVDDKLIKQLISLNSSIDSLAKEVSKIKIEAKESNIDNSDGSLNNLLKAISLQIEEGQESMQIEFDKNEDHLDRHLTIIQEIHKP